MKLASAETGQQMEVQPEAGLVSAPADSFVDFISVQTHLNWRDTVWGQPAWRPLLGDLGVRHTRSALGNRVAREHLLALHGDYGIRSSATFNAINDDGSFKLDATLRILESLRDKVGAEKIYAIEGPNEYTHRHKTEGWADRIRDYQEFLYNTVKSDAGLGGIDVLAPTIWKRIIEDYQAIGDMAAYADYGNLHLYNAGRRPSIFNRDEAETPIDVAIREAQIVVPNKPICVTETGFNVAEGAAPSKWTVPHDIAAKYILRGLAEWFLRRDLVKRVNIYSLIDDEHKDDHFGLLDASLTPRPAYLALRNLIKLLADPGPSFAPGSLSCRIEADDPNLRWLALQKRDKRFMLMLWLDANSYDREAAAAVEVASCPVTVDFGRSIASLTVYTPTISDAKLQELAAASNIKLEVPDHLMIVEAAL
jgi:hypothetical protein